MPSLRYFPLYKVFHSFPPFNPSREPAERWISWKKKNRNFIFPAKTCGKMHPGKLSNLTFEKKNRNFVFDIFPLYRVVHPFPSFRDRGKGKIEILSSLRYFPLYKVIHSFPPFNFSSSFAKTSKKMHHGKLSNLTFEKKKLKFCLSFDIFLYIKLSIRFLLLIFRRVS